MTFVRTLPTQDDRRCLDIVEDNGFFYVREFRRDPEDRGRWTLIADYSELSFKTETEAAAWAGHLGGLRHRP